MCVSTKARSLGPRRRAAGQPARPSSSAAATRQAGVFSDARAGASTNARRASSETIALGAHLAEGLGQVIAALRSLGVLGLASIIEHW